MKRNRFKFFCLSLSLLFCLQGCIALPAEKKETTTPPEKPPIIKPGGILGAFQNATYSYSTAVDESLLTTGHSERYLLLVNKEEANVLGPAYFPSALTTVTVPTNHEKTIQLEPYAERALALMYAEMAAEGVTDITVTSAYRSYEYQVNLFNYYLTKELAGISQDAYNCLGEDYINNYYVKLGVTKLTAEDAQKVVRSYSAEPGKSEHQSGLCVDFITADMQDHLTVAFEDTAAFAWLCENAHKFGFILRYPKGKEDITGYTYEPWHYRFVGREAATNMHLSGLTLEEYLDVWHNQE